MDNNKLYSDYDIYAVLHGQDKMGESFYAQPPAELMKRHLEDNCPEFLLKNKPVRVTELFAGRHEHKAFLQAGWPGSMKYTGIDLVPYDHRDHVQGDVWNVSFRRPDIVFSLYYSAQATCTNTEEEIEKLSKKVYAHLSDSGAYILHLCDEGPFESSTFTHDVYPLADKLRLGCKPEDKVQIKCRYAAANTPVASQMENRWTLLVNRKAVRDGKYSLSFSNFKASTVCKILSKIGFRIKAYELVVAEYELKAIPVSKANKLDTDYYIVAVK